MLTCDLKPKFLRYKVIFKLWKRSWKFESCFLLRVLFWCELSFVSSCLLLRGVFCCRWLKVRRKWAVAYRVGVCPRSPWTRSSHWTPSGTWGVPLRMETQSSRETAALIPQLNPPNKEGSSKTGSGSNLNQK